MPSGHRGSDGVYIEPFPTCTNTEGVWRDKGQARQLQQTPVGSGPARSGPGAAGNGQSRGATESGCLPVMRVQSGCPVFGATCQRPDKDFSGVQVWNDF